MCFDGSSEKNQLNDSYQIDLNQYEKISKFDEDKNFVLYKAIEKNSHINFLVKAIKNSSDDAEDLLKKVQILSSFNSPFLMKIKGYSLTDFDNNQNIAIIFEYAFNGSLRDFLDENKRNEKSEWNETQKLIFIYGIAAGMAYLHSKNIIHRDVIPNKIYIDEYLLPKIINSDHYLINYDAESSLGKGIGFLRYMPPEFFEEETQGYDQRLDVYSFAMIVYEIISGMLPPFKLKDSLIGKGIPMNPKIPQHYANLLNSCFEFDPKKRPTFNEIISILKTDKSFITDKIDAKEFYDFIESVENQNIYSKINFKEIYIEYTSIKELLVDIDPIDLSKYEKQQKIGKGQFGKVFKVKEKSTGITLAAKINIDLLEECKNININNLSREINILSKLNNLAILKFIGYNQNDFKNKAKPTIITEFSKNKSLEDIIDLQTRGLAPKEWNDTKLLITTYGIAFGMAYLHSKDIIHRDIKPGNIFFDEYLFPKIGDFGLSKEINDESPFDNSIYVGTPAFMSPEIFEGCVYSKAGDVYAFGMLLYQMVTLEQPFKDLNIFQLLSMISNNDRPKFHTDISLCYRELIERCWLKDASKRPTFEEIVDQLENDINFITENVDSNEYFEYIQYLKSNQINKKIEKITIDFEELQKAQANDPELNVSYLDLKLYKRQRLIKRIDNYKIFEIKKIENDKLYEAKISTTNIKNLTSNDLIHLSKEINILSKLNHPSFVKFIGYSPIDFNKKLNPVIVTEIPPNKSLDQLLQMERNQEHINEWNDTKKLINIYGISYGMKYLHANKVIHRNLSPKSIFLDEYLFPKIGNFGLLTKIHSTESMTFQTSVGIKGNVSYSSPELLEHNDYSFSNDVYAFALIVYEIITGDIPFNNINNYNKLYDEVVNKSKRPAFKTKIEPQYRTLIEECWSQNPDDRPTFKKISAILKNDSKFITGKINKEIFYKYTKFIEQSQISFNSNNQVVKFDELIQNKITNNEIKEEERQNTKQEEKTTDEKSKVKSEVNKGQSTEKQFDEKTTKKDQKYIDVDPMNENHKINEIDEIHSREDQIDDAKKLEIINEYLCTKQPDKLMDFLNDLENVELVLSVFNKCFFEHPDIYLNLCKKGILLNNAIAHHKYALALIFSPNANKSSFEEARNHLEESIKQGFSLSYFLIARILHEYFHEDSKAVEFLKKGSEKGDKYSKCLLGYFISRGIGIKKDHRKGIHMMLQSEAYDYYQRYASDIGKYYSNLSKESIHQEEKTKFSQKAFKWFELAYTMNKTKATINNYGICFMIGFGIQKNIEKAKEIFLNGAQQGDINSLYHLGFIFEKINPERSYNYYIEAAKHGHMRAQSHIKCIKKPK